MSERIEAGRETDVLVAERVMGARWRRGAPIEYVRRDGSTFNAVAWLDLPDLQCCVVEREDGGHEHYIRLPAYSTDRSAALEVVDRLIEVGIDVEMRATEDGNFVTLTKARSEWWLGSAGAHTLALAICAATLSESVLEHLAALRPSDGGEGQREG